MRLSSISVMGELFHFELLSFQAQHQRNYPQPTSSSAFTLSFQFYHLLYVCKILRYGPLKIDWLGLLSNWGIFLKKMISLQCQIQFSKRCTNKRIVWGDEVFIYRNNRGVLEELLQSKEKFNTWIHFLQMTLYHWGGVLPCQQMETEHLNFSVKTPLSQSLGYFLKNINYYRCLKTKSYTLNFIIRRTQKDHTIHS